MQSDKILFTDISASDFRHGFVMVGIYKSWLMVRNLRLRLVLQSLNLDCQSSSVG